MQHVEGKIEIFILIHKLKSAALLARRHVGTKSAGTTMQHAKGKIEIFTHIHKLGSVALLARFKHARCDRIKPNSGETHKSIN